MVFCSYMYRKVGEKEHIQVRATWLSWCWDCATIKSHIASSLYLVIWCALTWRRSSNWDWDECSISNCTEMAMLNCIENATLTLRFKMNTLMWKIFCRGWELESCSLLTVFWYLWHISSLVGLKNLLAPFLGNCSMKYYQKLFHCCLFCFNFIFFFPCAFVKGTEL